MKTEVLQEEKYSISKKNIANSFAQAASSYDEYAVLQREVADRLLAKVSCLQGPERILDLGSGTGYCTEILRSIFPEAEIISLDIAEGMLSYARTKNKVDSVCADAEALPFIEQSFDLIVSSLAIQWCKFYPKLFEDLQRILCSGGEMYLSTFGTGTLQELKQAWQKVDNYVHVNNFVEKEVLEKCFADCAYSDIDIEQSVTHRYYPSLKSLTRELKAIGAHNMNQGQAKGLGGRQKISSLKRSFEEKYIPGLGIPVTYDIYYIHLSKQA